MGQQTLKGKLTLVLLFPSGKYEQVHGKYGQDWLILQGKVRASLVVSPGESMGKTGCFSTESVGKTGRFFMQSIGKTG